MKETRVGYVTTSHLEKELKEYIISMGKDVEPQYITKYLALVEYNK